MTTPPLADAPADGWVLPPDDPKAWDRAATLAQRAFARIDRTTKLLWAVTGIGLGIVLGANIGGMPVPTILVLTVVAVGLVACSAAVLYRDPGLRAGVELFGNHQLREMREFRAENGSRPPRGRRAIERWVERNPESVDRATPLTFLGRFAEADAAVREGLLRPGRDTPEDRLSADIARATIALYAGRDPQLERVRASWSALPAGPRRAELLECLVLIEAQASQRSPHAGADPMALLAAARSSSAPIVRQARVLWIAGVLSALPLIVSAVFVALRLLR